MPKAPQAVLSQLLSIADEYHFDLRQYQGENVDLLPLGDKPEAYLAYFAEEGSRSGRYLPFRCTLSDVERFARDRRLDGPLKRDVLRSLVASALRLNHSLLDADDRTLTTILSWRRFGFQPYIVIGDSHCYAYGLGYSVTRDLLPLRVQCEAGSAKGLGNPNSRSGYGRKIRDWLARLSAMSRRPYRLVWCFGQVDVEFVLYFNALRDGLPVDLARAMQFCDDIVPGYVDYVSATSRGKFKPAVATIFPPCLSDAAIAAGYINPSVASVNSETDAVTLSERLRGLAVPDLAGRTSIHAYFNSKLAEACMRRNIPIVDVASALIADNGIVFDYYAEHGGTDHHLSFTTFRQQLHRAIEPLACVSIPQRIRLDITRRLFRRD